MNTPERWPPKGLLVAAGIAYTSVLVNIAIIAYLLTANTH